MEKLLFNKFLLKVAFSCMACDGDIDAREISLIKEMHSTNKLFGVIDIDSSLDVLFDHIKKNGRAFIKEFFSELTNNSFSEQEELLIIKTAIDTINADEKVEYSEIKFFKVIRSQLDIKDHAILDAYPTFEPYLEQDIISRRYLDRLINDYFDSYNMESFKTIEGLSDILNKSIGLD